MKPGQKFNLDHRTLLEPLVGHLVTVTVDGSEVKARIQEVLPGHVAMSVVPNTTKE